jgi:hypothetical protein
MSARALRGSGEWVARVGAALSLTCAVHCALAPFLIAGVPLAAASWLFDESVEAAFICGSLATALVSLGMGVRVHRRRPIFILLGLAVLFIATAQCADDRLAEIALVTAGAVTLTAAHAANVYLCRRCRACDHASGGPDHGHRSLP